MSSTTLSKTISSREANQTLVTLELMKFLPFREQDKIYRESKKVQGEAFRTLADMYTEPVKMTDVVTGEPYLLWAEEDFEVVLDKNGVQCDFEGNQVGCVHLLQRFLTSAVGLELEYKRSKKSFGEWLSQISREEELV